MHLNGFFVKTLQCDVTGSVPERTGINFTQKIFSLKFDGLINASFFHKHILHFHVDSPFLFLPVKTKMCRFFFDRYSIVVSFT